jgi:hypothetical protein
MGKCFPRGIPTESIVLREFLSDLLLKPYKGSGQSKDYRLEKGHTSWGGIGIWGMRGCRL